MVVVLTMFEGYTVDERLREFRKVHHVVDKHGEIHHSLEFLPFDTPKGRRLLKRYRKAGG